MRIQYDSLFAKCSNHVQSLISLPACHPYKSSVLGQLQKMKQIFFWYCFSLPNFGVDRDELGKVIFCVGSWRIDLKLIAENLKLKAYLLLILHFAQNRANY